jgi:stringent starvation protein B
MSSNRPYLIRAIYEWIGDNGMTPHLLVDASQPGVQVPPQSVKDGQVVLNIAARAVGQLDLGNEGISFMARFSGVSRSVRVPLQAVLAIYAQETGQGMMLPREEEPPGGATAGEAMQPTPTPEDDGPKRPHLRVIK